MTIKPLLDRVVIKSVEAEETTQSGIILAGSAKEKPQISEVTAEDITTTQREGYDFAVARAVANMRVLTEYCMPFVKVGGSFIAMKGASAEEETLEATKAISVLGGTLIKKDMFNLGDLGVRGIINVKKISQTSTKYPRNPAKISKQPL